MPQSSRPARLGESWRGWRCGSREGEHTLQGVLKPVLAFWFPKAPVAMKYPTPSGHRVATPLPPGAAETRTFNIEHPMAIILHPSSPRTIHHPASTQCAPDGPCGKIW